ncbi:hypothetical protein [Croceicoccus marinus]|nr:hypothetical protein [Croceicoccus marinus]
MGMGRVPDPKKANRTCRWVGALQALFLLESRHHHRAGHPGSRQAGNRECETEAKNISNNMFFASAPNIVGSMMVFFQWWHCILLLDSASRVLEDARGPGDQQPVPRCNTDDRKILAVLYSGNIMIFA